MVAYAAMALEVSVTETGKIGGVGRGQDNVKK